MAKPRELFLSHCASDRKFLTRLTRVLRDFNIGFWYSHTHLIGAQRWHDEIGKALRRCDWFLVILSPAAIRSTWVELELFYALNSDRLKHRIVPVLLHECEYDKLSWTLAAIQRVDFTKDFDDGCRALLRIWKLAYKPDSRKAGERKASRSKARH